jgi:outer membrane protein OmpA-like peptidoglycan-associated protein
VKAIALSGAPRLAPAVAAVLAVGLTACGLAPAGQPGTARMMTLPAARSSVLIVIADQGSPQAMTTAGRLISRTARAGEQIVVLGERNRAVLATSVAPAQPQVPAPVSPSPLPAHPTSFQKAHYQQATRHYQDELRRARASLRSDQRAHLASWAQAATAGMAARAGQPHAASPDISGVLGDAAADLSSFRQSGDGSTETVAIIGVSQVDAQSVAGVPVGLQGATVVVGDFQGTADEEAAWQASLDQAGARRAVILTPATDNQLGPTVQQGLDGAVADTLTSVLFGLGQFTLEPAALPQLRKLLHLLTVTYPTATASIDGYTDDLPAPGGNLQLSERRAQEVLSWLLANNVAAGRLQAAGYGDTDRVAPNTPSGQPLNRRVVVIIDPAAGR